MLGRQVQPGADAADEVQVEQPRVPLVHVSGTALLEDDSDEDEPRATLNSQDVLSLVLSFSLRHGLSNAGISDLIDLLNIVNSSDCELVTTRYHLMKDIAHRLNKQTTHFYCMSDDCMAYVNKTDTVCGDCQTAFSAKEAKRAGRYFLQASIEEQLKDLLESGFVDRHRVKAGDGDGEQLYADVVDGELYRSHNLLSGSEGMSNLSLTWNFDGVQMHKSSSKTMWPILATAFPRGPE